MTPDEERVKLVRRRWEEIERQVGSHCSPSPPGPALSAVINPNESRFMVATIVNTLKDVAPVIIGVAVVAILIGVFSRLIFPPRRD